MDKNDIIKEIKFWANKTWADEINSINFLAQNMPITNVSFHGANNSNEVIITDNKNNSRKEEYFDDIKKVLELENKMQALSTRKSFFEKEEDFQDFISSILNNVEDLSAYACNKSKQLAKCSAVLYGASLLGTIATFGLCSNYLGPIESRIMISSLVTADISVVALLISSLVNLRKTKNFYSAWLLKSKEICDSALFSENSSLILDIKIIKNNIITVSKYIELLEEEIEKINEEIENLKNAKTYNSEPPLESISLQQYYNEYYFNSFVGSLAQERKITLF